MNGGDITYTANIDDSELEKELARTQKKIQKLTEQRESSTVSRDMLTQQLEEQGVKLDEAKAKLEEYRLAREAAQASGVSSAVPVVSNEDYQQQEALVAELQRKFDATATSVERYNARIADATAQIDHQNQRTAELTSRIRELGTPPPGGGTPFNGWDAALKKVEKRIAGLIKRVFFFSLSTKALRAALTYFNNILKTNKEFQSELARLKAAIATAFQPLIEIAIPALTRLLKILTAAFTIIANIISKVFGKTAAQSAKNAKALNSEAEAISGVGGAAAAAEKKLASFDEVNNLGDSSDSGGGDGVGSGLDFDSFDFDGYTEKLMLFQAGLSAAALALGVILTFSGVNIPLGLALIALGAAGLYATAVEDWGAIPSEIAKSVVKILAIAGIGCLAIGAILAFSGVKIGLGIAMMAAGAAMLITASVVNWRSMDGNIESAIHGIIQIVSPALLVLGAIMCFSGAAVPIGIALMIAGAAGLATEVYLNWSSMEEELNGPIAAVTLLVSGAIIALGAILAFSGVNMPLGIALLSTGGAGLIAGAAAAKWDGNAIVEALQGPMGTLVALVSGAFLVVGALLTFSGVNIPVGLGMMALGVAGLATEATLNWNTIIEWIQNNVDTIAYIVSGSLLAVGALLCFSGVGVPIGIGLIAAGVAGIAGTAVATNWNAIVEELQGPMGTVVAMVSGAFLVVGALLTFSGVNIPVGLGMMALGVAGLATEATLNWNTIVEELQGPMGTVVAMVSGAFLVVGALLCFSGVGIPLGLGMIAIGAAGLATEVALNWNAIVEELQGPIGEVVGIVSGALLVLGLILCFTGVGIPLGIGLILAGAAGLATEAAVNWNFFTDKIREIWRSIKRYWNTNIAPKFTLEFWSQKFSAIGEGLKQKVKDGINVAIGLFNQFVSWINEKMNLSWGSFEILGQEIIPAGSLQLITLPSIPLLAKGAVIPPNAPFMAMLGDQRSGTNIEAPLSTIQQAVSDVVSSDMMYQAFLRALTDAGAGRVYLDGREIYDSMHDYERRQNKAYGW